MIPDAGSSWSSGGGCNTGWEELVKEVEFQVRGEMQEGKIA